MNKLCFESFGPITSSMTSYAIGAVIKKWGGNDNDTQVFATVVQSLSRPWSRDFTILAVDYWKMTTYQGAGMLDAEAFAGAGCCPANSSSSFFFQMSTSCFGLMFSGTGSL